jgi:DNA-binding sugar fermentation-stimulating protein
MCLTVRLKKKTFLVRSTYDPSQISSCAPRNYGSRGAISEKERKQGVRPRSRTDMLSAATFEGQVYMHVKSAAVVEASAVYR